MPRVPPLDLPRGAALHLMMSIYTLSIPSPSEQIGEEGEEIGREDGERRGRQGRAPRNAVDIRSMKCVVTYLLASS